MIHHMLNVHIVYYFRYEDEIVLTTQHMIIENSKLFLIKHSQTLKKREKRDFGTQFGFCDRRDLF